MNVQFIESFDGVRLAVSVDGPAGGQPIILSHYLGGSRTTWSAQVAVLADNYRVIRYDTRGQGESDAPDGPYDIAILGRDAVAVMDAFGIEKTNFIGLSQGGMTGMWMAANHPERIARLVLANTTPFIPTKPVWNELIAKSASDGMKDIASATIRSWLSEGFKVREPEETKALVAIMAAMSPAGYAGNCAVLRDVDLRDALPSIVAPTLVIGGAEDGPRGASGPVMASAVANGRLAMIDGAAHLSHVENSQGFNRAMLDHLR